MRKLIVSIAACAALGLALVLPTAASAEPPNGGGYCGASATGCEAAHAAAELAPCSGYGAGAFGAIGHYGDVYENLAGGADGHQTGLNNSGVCGNRQGNL